MARDKNSAKRRAPAAPNEQPSERIPVRLAPADDPAETVERLLSRRQLIVEDGDIVVVRETARISRGTTVVASLGSSSMWQYRVTVRGQHESRRVFATYERGVVDGEALAAERRVRLFYAEDLSLTLLKDYRPSAGR